MLRYKTFAGILISTVVILVVGSCDERTRTGTPFSLSLKTGIREPPIDREIDDSGNWCFVDSRYNSIVVVASECEFEKPLLNQIGSTVLLFDNVSRLRVFYELPVKN